MKKRTILALLATATVTASIFSGCGSKGNAVDALSGDHVIDMEASNLENGETPEGEPTEKNPAGSNVSGESQDKKSAPNTQSTADPTNTTSSEDKPNTDTNNSGRDKTDSSSTSNSGSKADTTSSKPSNGNSSNANTNNNTSSNTQPSTTQTSQPSAPAHEHVWHEHTVTTQQWVPNMVTVDDYETRQVVVGSQIQCNCGATFTNGADADAHGMAHILAGEDDGWGSVDIWGEEQVKVGSHQEDQGHYETVTTVDYYYCDCGATK